MSASREPSVRPADLDPLDPRASTVAMERREIEETRDPEGRVGERDLKDDMDARESSGILDCKASAWVKDRREGQVIEGLLDGWGTLDRREQRDAW